MMDACAETRELNDNSFDNDGWNEALAEINLNLHASDTNSKKQTPTATAGHVYKFQNVAVNFPYSAYRSQLQMMDKIFQGVTTGANCLLESPTGTGKTAALLCSLLAWQKDCYERNDNCGSIIEAAIKERFGGCSCGLIKNENTKVVLTKKNEKWNLSASTEVSETPKKNYKILVNSSPCDKASHMKRFPVMPSNPLLSSCCQTEKPNIQLQADSSNLGSPTKMLRLSPCSPSPVKYSSIECEERELEDVCAFCTRKFLLDRSRPPRIYYATRTHSQIAQVVKQLKNTSYRNVKMTILASREPTCIYEKIHEEVYQSQNQSQKNLADDEIKIKLTRDDVCRQLRSNYYKLQKLKERFSEESQVWQKLLSEIPVCRYFRPKSELESAFHNFQKLGAWDLENITTEGKSCKRCPYYGCYALHESADIVFCSYNYLIYPSLRKTADIKFVNSVIVFDEAHNIEDICRDAFSLTINDHKFDNNIRALVDNLLFKLANGEAYVSLPKEQALTKLSAMFQKWSTWIKEKGIQIRAPCTNKLLDARISLDGQNLLDVFNEMAMTSKDVDFSLTLIKTIEEEVDGEDEFYMDHRNIKRPFRFGSAVKNFLGELLQSLKYVFGEEKDFIGGVKDFRGFLTRTSNVNHNNVRQSHRSSSHTLPSEPEFYFTLQIICLNPAIGFRILKNSAFSIIVTSGTLTPLNSFASELSTEFGITLQADHVIPKTHVWAGVVSVGPSKQTLRLTKNYQDDPEVQDDIGNIVAQICETVPNGILVFLPSYVLMSKLTQRWRVNPTGNPIFQRIGKTKLIFFEESRSKEVFKRNMEEYVEKVKGGTTWNGCILFAVFRGKISEGIDFADEQARAVITIGIPYSNVMAVEIQSKKQYNDIRKANQKSGELILSGSEWYTTQAFRAMNQGFGRCVRHSEDWGALILIDSRLGQRHSEPYISGWVKNSLEVFYDFDLMKQKLKHFVVERQRPNKRAPIKIQYETNLHPESELDCTEIIPFSQHGQNLFNCVEGENRDYGEPTQVVRSISYQNVDSNEDITQQCVESIEEEVAFVSESSPEYSFLEENEFPLRCPNSAPYQACDLNNSNSSSISVFEISNTSRRSSSANDSDLEMSRIADIMQPRANNPNQSDIMDISMPSTISGDEVSEASSISYHSD